MNESNTQNLQTKSILDRYKCYPTSEMTIKSNKKGEEGIRTRPGSNREIGSGCVLTQGSSRGSLSN